MIKRLLKSALASVIVALPFAVHAQTQYRYWFDRTLTPESIVTGALSGNASHIEIDASGLSPNIHLLNFQIMGDDGVWGQHSHICFFKADYTALPNAETAEVYVDGSIQQTYTASSLTGNLMLDLSDLTNGLHTVHTVVIDDKGHRHSCPQAFFSKIANVDNNAQSVEVYVDESLQQTYEVSALTNTILLDLASISDGLHTIYTVVVDSRGNRIPCQKALFSKIDESKAIAASFEVKIDGESVLNQELTGGLCQLALDESELPTGLHEIEIVAHAADGSVYPSSRAFFYRLADEQTRLAKYRYWINNDNRTASEVVLEPDADGLQLISMLNMPEMPFSSHSFSCHPEEDGGITMTPENTIRWLFTCNDDAHALYRERSYSDDRAKIPVPAEDVAALPKAVDSELAVTEIGDNNVRWYSIDAEIGTMLKWRADCAVEMDLFDVSGQRLLDIDGSSSMRDSEYIFSDGGKYYLALHDAAMNAAEVRLTYTLINRFDVVGCTPGYGVADSTVFVDLKGNSFENATAFFLSRDGFDIPADQSYGADSNNERLRFDLQGKNLPLGEYDIKAVFSNPDNGNIETVTLPGALRLEELREGEQNVDIQFIPKLENPMHFTVTVTNTGNETLWGVPFNIAFEDNENITNMTAVNFGIDVAADFEEKGVKTAFHTDNLLGTGKPGTFIPMLIDVLTPGEHKYLFRFTESGPTSFEVYAWLGAPWSRRIEDDLSNADGNLLTWEKICIEAGLADGEKEGCFDDARQYLYNHYFGGIDVSLIEDIGEEVPKKNTLVAFGTSKPLSRGLVLTKVIWPGDKDKNKEVPPGSNDNGGKDASKPDGNGRPGTPGTPGSPGAPGNNSCNITINVTVSIDPNDIIGYKSPSGTEHIGIDVKTIDYKIEFENDPDFATAPASIISIKSRLDPDKFDLNSLRPKTVRIGRNTQEWTSASSKVKTLDMRPAIDAVAQVTYELDPATGELRIDISSLDPMTMEQAVSTAQGILPVNTDGEEGIGEFIYEIGLKDNLESEVQIENSAEITFDRNDPVETPVWVNVTDYKRPVSRVISVVPDVSTGTARIGIRAEDEGSGVWEYQLLVREYSKLAGVDGSDGLWKMVGTINTSGQFEMPVDGDLVYELCSVVRDRAGNYEEKTLRSEMKISDFDNVEDTWTGVETLYNDRTYVDGDDTLYDLLGKRVLDPEKGIYVRKGEKVLIR